MKLITKNILIIIFIFFGAINLTKAQVEASTSELEHSIDKIFKGFDNPQVPGAAVAVTQGGEIVFKKGYGSANLEYDIPVTPKTIFHVASVSKQFTVFALLLLEEEGKLALDDPIQKHIAEVPDFGHTITLRHLATHTSGMRDQWDLLNLAGWRWDDVITKEHILKIVAKQKDLNFKPGEKYMYCNTGFTLLAEVVARVSGKTFDQFTQDRMFKPLQMTNSLFYEDHQRIVKNRAYSYYPWTFGYKKSVLSYANAGATSLFTTVEDLSKWAMNFKEQKVGSKKIINQMNTLAVLNNGETFGGAYGQFVGEFNGLLQIGHSGGDAGYRSYLGRFPEQDFAVSVVSNNGGSNPADLANKVAEIYLKKDFVTETKNKIEKPKTISLTKEELENFEGHYWSATDLYARKIHVKQGKLHYDRGNGSSSELAAIDKNSFLMLNVPNEVSVNFSSKNGKKHIVVLEGDKTLGTLDEYTPIEESEIEKKSYLGSYTSQELSTTYTIIEKEGVLLATHPRSSDIALFSIKKDVFKAGGNTIVFTRNKASEINGLEVSTGRVKNLKFIKD